MSKDTCSECNTPEKKKTFLAELKSIKRKHKKIRKNNRQKGLVVDLSSVSKRLCFTSLSNVHPFQSESESCDSFLRKNIFDLAKNLNCLRL